MTKLTAAFHNFAYAPQNIYFYVQVFPEVRISVWSEINLKSSDSLYEIPYSLSQLQNSIQSLSTTKVSSTYFVNYFNYLIHSQTKPLRHLWEQKASTAHPTSLYWTLLRPLNTGVHSAGPRERSPCLLVMLLGTLPCFHSPTFHNVLIGAPGSHDATSGAPGSSLSYSFILFSFHFLSLFVCLYASIFLNYVFYCCVYVFIL